MLPFLVVDIVKLLAAAAVFPAAWWVVGRRPATADGPDPGLYGPGSEAWRLNREAALLLGAGPAGAPAPARASPRGRGRRPALRLPRRPLGAAGRHPPQLPPDRVRDASAARAEIRRLDRLPPVHRGPRARRGDRRAVRGGLRRRASRSCRCGSTPRSSTRRWPRSTRGSSRCPRTSGAASTRRRWPWAGCSGCPSGLLPADIDAFDAYMASMLAPDRSRPPDGDRARARRRSILHPPLAPLVESGPIAARLGPLGLPVAAVLGRSPRPRRLAPRALDRAPAATTRAEYGLAWGPRERAVDAWLIAAWRVLAAPHPARVALVPAGAGRRPASRHGEARRLDLARARRPVGHRVGQRADRDRRPVARPELEPEPLDPVPALLLPADLPELARSARTRAPRGARSRPGSAG